MQQLVHRCDIARKQVLGTNGRKEMNALYSAVPCLMMPMNNATAITNGFDLSKAVDFYFDVGQDVKVGDILTYSGRTYLVKAVQSYDVPLVGHIHVMAQQEVS